MKELLEEGDADPWVRDICQIEEEIRVPIVDLSLKEVSKRIAKAAAEYVIKAREQHESVGAMPVPEAWFRLPMHVDDSWSSRIINQCRSGNLLLGNRAKNRLGEQYKYCPWCEETGRIQRLSEVHVILECGANSSLRRRLSILAFVVCVKQRQAGLSNLRILREYLGQDGAMVGVLKQRGRAISSMVECWFQEVAAI